MLGSRLKIGIWLVCIEMLKKEEEKEKDEEEEEEKEEKHGEEKGKRRRERKHITRNKLHDNIDGMLISTDSNKLHDVGMVVLFKNVSLLEELSPGCRINRLLACFDCHCKLRPLYPTSMDVTKMTLERQDENEEE